MKTIKSISKHNLAIESPFIKGKCERVSDCRDRFAWTGVSVGDGILVGDNPLIQPGSDVGGERMRLRSSGLLEAKFGVLASVGGNLCQGGERRRREGRMT